jgi:hypothetical protein
LTTIKNAKGEFIVGMRIGDRGIITWSRDRAQRDAKMREDILAKIRIKLAKRKVSSKTFVSNSNYAYFIN